MPACDLQTDRLAIASAVLNALHAWHAVIIIIIIIVVIILIICYLKLESHIVCQVVTLTALLAWLILSLQVSRYLSWSVRSCTVGCSLCDIASPVDGLEVCVCVGGQGLKSHACCKCNSKPKSRMAWFWLVIIIIVIKFVETHACS